MKTSGITTYSGYGGLESIDGSNWPIWLMSTLMAVAFLFLVIFLIWRFSPSLKKFAETICDLFSGDWGKTL